MIRFHLDESVNSRLAVALRQRGVDVTTPIDVGLKSASDEQQLDFATVQDRVLVTHDADFLRMHQTRPAHSGIAYCAPDSRPFGYLVRYLCLMNDCYAPEDMRGRIEYL